MPAIDSHTAKTGGVSNAFTVAMTTDTTNEVVFVVVSAQAGTGGGASGATSQVTSITDDSGLNWQRRTAVVSTDGALLVTELWWAPSPLPLSSNNINVFLNDISRSAILVFAVAGLSSIYAPFDANPSCPTPITYPTASGASPPISTNQARALLILACGGDGEVTVSFGAPFSTIDSAAGIYVAAFAGYSVRLSQANNVQAVVTTNGSSPVNIIGDAVDGPGWLRADVFTGGF